MVWGKGWREAKGSKTGLMGGASEKICESPASARAMSLIMADPSWVYLPTSQGALLPENYLGRIRCLGTLHGTSIPTAQVLREEKSCLLTFCYIPPLRQQLPALMRRKEGNWGGGGSRGLEEGGTTENIKSHSLTPLSGGNAS